MARRDCDTDGAALGHRMVRRGCDSDERTTAEHACHVDRPEQHAVRKALAIAIDRLDWSAHLLLVPIEMDVADFQWCFRAYSRLVRTWTDRRVAASTFARGCFASAGRRRLAGGVAAVGTVALANAKNIAAVDRCGGAAIFNDEPDCRRTAISNTGKG